jgi:hypothetical protein
MEPYTFDPPDAEEREAVGVLQASEFALDSGAAAVEAAPFVGAARDAKVALFLADA